MWKLELSNFKIKPSHDPKRVGQMVQNPNKTHHPKRVGQMVQNPKETKGKIIVSEKFSDFGSGHVPGPFPIGALCAS